MSKQEFLAQLRKGLFGVPQDDIEERLTFYSEMIDDRMEDGLSEEDAIREIGSIDEIVSQTIADIPLAKLVKEKIKPNRTLRGWKIVLLVLGSPLWLPLLIAAFAVILSFYVVIWSVIISLWAVEALLAVYALCSMTAGVIFAFHGNGLTGISLISTGLISAGLTVFLFFGCKEVTKGILLLTKKIALGIKNIFIRKDIA